MTRYQMEECLIDISDKEEVIGEVVSPTGGTKRLKGFRDDSGIGHLRFLPNEDGEWSVNIADKVQKIAVKAADEPSESIRIEGNHFIRESKEYFYPFGTTVYALLYQTEELLRETLESLANSPFNKIRFCIFPKSYDYNQQEPPFFPFEKLEENKWDLSRPDERFWQRLDFVLEELFKMDIQADIILFHPYDRWGFATMSSVEDQKYIDYVLCRLSAYPHIWWSLANEYDLLTEKTIEDWNKIENYISEHDPYDHLLSNHNCYAFWDFSRENITHTSIQTKNLTRIGEWAKKYQKPVVIDECCYEGNLDYLWGSVSGKEMTNRFWRVVSQGGYCTHGETYADDVNDENSIIWWSHGGKLRGSSPERIEFLKKIVEELPSPLTYWEPPQASIMEAVMAGDENALNVIPEMYQGGLRAFLRMGDEILPYSMGETPFQGRSGEDAFLVFYDIRTPSRGIIDLPEDGVYRIEVIDTWEMTRKTVSEKASGHSTFDMPNREGMAVLATKIS